LAGLALLLLRMASAGAISIRTFVPADFDQCINLYADGMNYYSQSNGYEGLRGPVCALPLTLS
jgi:hypothetical protein